MSNPNPFSSAGLELLKRFEQFRQMRSQGEGSALQDTIPTRPRAPSPPQATKSSSDPSVMLADMIRRALFGTEGADMTTLPEVVVSRPSVHPDPTVANDQGIPFQAMVAPTIADAGHVFRRNGKLLVDVRTRRWKDGRTTTHNIALLPPEVQHGEKRVEDYEDEVLARPRNQFSRAVDRVVSDLAALQPGVRERFEALKAAAQAAGHSLSVSETRRSQERQDWLFQSGRSRPGPIATWTLTSDHRDGRALDLRGRSQADYQWLWDNAERFGFRAMGEIDPGHIYVPLGDDHPRQSSRATGTSRKQANPG